MNENRVDQLKDALRELIKIIVNRGQPLSEELKSMIAKVTEHVANRIMEIRSQGTEGEVQELILNQPIPLNPSIDSSNINSFGYDDATGELRVKFNGKDERDGGSTYSYGGVPKVIFDLFRKGAIPARTTGKNKWGSWWEGKVPSAGASFYTLIKETGYPYKKLS